jgi:KipI family sensor histidine kinase inhibitor
MRLLPYGDRAVLVELPDLDSTLRLAAAVDAADLPGVVDVVPAERTVLVTTSGDPAELGRVLVALPDGKLPGGSTDGVIEVAVTYDGPDLAHVASLTGLDPAQVVAAHTGRPWVAAFCGFLPGFTYLVGGDERLRVPRRDDPRPRVPVGSVGLAEGYSGVYPRSTPGGWQLIGRTDALLWDPDADPPTRLRPGATVRFVDAASGPPGSVRGGPDPIGGHRGHPEPIGSGSAVEVLATGPSVLVEDLGRPGLAHLGVGRSGAADRGAHALAQRLVANNEGSAGLEVVLGGLRLRARGDLLVAVTGARAPLSVNGRAVAHAAPFTVRHGQELALGAPHLGLRSCVAVRGGLEVDAVLGSRSTDVLAGLGPPPVAAGDVLAVGAPPGRWPVVDVAPYAEPSAATVLLTVTPGPRADRLTDPAALLDTTWTVSPDSDRVGLRLQGPPLRTTHDPHEPLPSEGILPGALQVPPGGHPVVFLADCPVTGGYPVVAVVRDTDVLAQVRPGQQVRFRRGERREMTRVEFDPV